MGGDAEHPYSFQDDAEGIIAQYGSNGTGAGTIAAPHHLPADADVSKMLTWWPSAGAKNGRSARSRVSLGCDVISPYTIGTMYRQNKGLPIDFLHEKLQ